MTNEPSAISIAALAPNIGTCELCVTPDQTLRAAITVRHFRGGTMSFAGCERCATAVRRIIAAAGGVSAIGPALVSVEASPVLLQTKESAAELVGMPTLALEFAEPFVGPDARQYLVRVWAQGRTDGTWVGWLAFVGVARELVRVTPPETSQSNLDGVRYWASGLQPSYLEGAFQRTESR